jgi:broad specificity phosphatase PhoE
MLKGAEEKFGPCNIKVLRVSGMARAKETAEIIASHLPTVEFAEPDLLLNEGRLVWIASCCGLARKETLTDPLSFLGRAIIFPADR